VAVGTAQPIRYTWAGEIFEGQFGYKISKTSPIPAEIHPINNFFASIPFVFFPSPIPLVLLIAFPPFGQDTDDHSQMHFDLSALTLNGHLIFMDPCIAV
jgi:hypothetical protein